MKIRTNLKAGRRPDQHNETLRLRTKLRAGGMDRNHNQTLR